MRYAWVVVISLVACGDNLVPTPTNECTQPSDCPGADTPCVTKTCENSACGLAFTPAGTAVTQQTAGDCQTAQCDGTGLVEMVADDSDVPDDGNPCTSEGCADGVPQHGVEPIGTACGSGLECDGGGACVHCNLPSECPGSDSDCAKRTCFFGVCGVDNINMGTVAAHQVAGDCQKLVCDGAGGETSTIDDTDKPVDGNACTTDVCTSGVPSNPDVPAGTSCGGGKQCDATGDCVQCLQPTDCPGSDSECQVRTCTAGVCGVSNTAAGTVTSQQTVGDCHQQQCDGNGGFQQVVDDGDVPDDNNACTTDACTNGVPSHTDVSSGTSCGGALICDGNGNCVGCVTPSDCPGADTECHQRTCVGGNCGVNNTANGTLISTQQAGDCKDNVCDGNGNITTQQNNSDVPVDNEQCTNDVCSGGVPSNPPTNVGTTCNEGAGNIVCDGAGHCVECNVEQDCPGTDTDCQTRTCASNTCGISDANSGTLTSTQTTGDCHDNVCDGNGNAISIVDNGDVPNDSNPCTTDACTNGAPSNTNVSNGTACGPGLCETLGSDPTSRCQVPFLVLRVGSGAAALDNKSTASFLDRFDITGALLGSTALPVAASGAQAACTLQGTANAEGMLTRSADGHLVTFACYGVAPGTANPGQTTAATVPRVAGKIDGSGAVDTSTVMATGFDTQPLRSAVTNDGTTVWVGGGNGGATGGVWATTLGATTGEVQVLSNPITARQVQIAAGQLFATSSTAGFGNVFTIGSGLPTTAGQTATTLPGMNQAANSMFGFALFDESVVVSGLDTLYVADQRVIASGGGLEKWTFDGNQWALAKTFQNGLVVNGLQNLAAYQNGSGEVVILATTVPAGVNSVVMLVDDGSANPAFTTLATSALNTQFRGVAVTPQ